MVRSTCILIGAVIMAVLVCQNDVQGTQIDQEENGDMGKPFVPQGPGYSEILADHNIIRKLAMDDRLPIFITPYSRNFHRKRQQQPSQYWSKCQHSPLTCLLRK